MGFEFREVNCIVLIGDVVVDGIYDFINFLLVFVFGLMGGNLDFDFEEVEIIMIGIVWRLDIEFDGMLEGLVVILDYYNIEIDGLIDSFIGFDIVFNCVDVLIINN